MRSIQRIVDSQVERWSVERRAERERQGAADPAPEQFHPWIAIARDYGSGGTVVGQLLAARLGYAFYDREILDAIARESNYRREFIESIDETSRNAIESHVDALLHGESFAPSDFLRYLMRVVLTIGETGRAIIVGRGANHILPASHGLSVRIIAPFEQRAETVARRLSITREAAREKVREIDRDRAEFHRVHFHRSSWSPEDYDLIINLARTAPETSVALIETTLLGRFPEERPSLGTVH